MKAAVMEAERAPLVVQDIDEPEIGPDDALIRVQACGVCRSDWHRWYGDLGWMGTPRQLPTVLGHEQAGIVEKVGSNVTAVAPGQRVLTPFHNGCGDSCRYCQSGLSNLCEKPGQRSGGFAQYSRIANANFNAIPLADEISFEAGAAMVCRYMTAYHGVADRGEVKGGEWVAIHGCGGIGMSAIQVANALGAQVIAVDLDEAKLAMAREHGAAFTVDVRDGDVPAQIKDITGGGADVSIDALGIGATILQSVGCLRKRGIHVQIGVTSQEDAGQVSLPVDVMTLYEIQFRGSLGNPNHLYRPMLNMVASGKLRPEALVGERIGLNDITRVFESMTQFQTVGFTTITDFN